MTKPYHVKFAPVAYEQIIHLPTKFKKMIVKLAQALAVNPRPPGARKVEGMLGLYCEQINQHRLVYKIEEYDVFILLIKDNRLI